MRRRKVSFVQLSAIQQSAEQVIYSWRKNGSKLSS